MFLFKYFLYCFYGVFGDFHRDFTTKIYTYGESQTGIKWTDIYHPGEPTVMLAHIHQTYETKQCEHSQFIWTKHYNQGNTRFNG